MSRAVSKETKPIKARGLKKADREVDCFFIDVSFSRGFACDCRSERGVEAPRLNVRARSRSRVQQCSTESVKRSFGEFENLLSDAVDLRILAATVDDDAAFDG